jgi:competence protein ComEA
MNLRLPIVAAIVVAAAGAAAVRAFHPLVAPGFAPDRSIQSPSPAPRPSLAAGGGRETRIVVYVAGEVRRGGIYELPPSARAFDALRAAGGATANADMVAVNLAQPLADGDEVAVPALGARRSAHARSRSGHARARHKKKKHREERDAPTTVIDLNAADESELEGLPGIGPALAQRIVAFRQQAGRYGSSDDLLDVAGMTQRKLDAIAPYVAVR